MTPVESTPWFSGNHGNARLGFLPHSRFAAGDAAKSDQLGCFRGGAEINVKPLLVWSLLYKFDLYILKMAD